MSAPQSAKVYRLVERDGPAGRRVLQGGSVNRHELLVVAGVRGTDWPESLANPAIEARGPAPDGIQWRLTSEQGEFDFEARAVDRVELRPELYVPMHRPFALTLFDRIAVRVLLALLRLPVGARLLRRWHARRNG